MDVSNAGDVAFTLNLIANAEGGDGSQGFYRSIQMPDGATAWDWIQRWPELKEAVYKYIGRNGMTLEAS